MSDLVEFLLARIKEDYATECGRAGEGSAVETAARIRANLRSMNAYTALAIMNNEVVPYAKTEALQYADHPDYDDTWRP